MTGAGQPHTNGQSDAPCRYCGGTERRHTVMCPHAPPPASSQPTPDRDALREQIAAALRAHQWEAVNRPDGSTSVYRCTCGHIPADTPSLDDHRADVVLDVLAPHLDALDRARNLLRVWETVAQPQRQGTFAHALRRALDGDGA